MQKKKERIKRMKQWDRLICNDDSSLGYANIVELRKGSPQF